MDYILDNRTNHNKIQMIELIYSLITMELKYKLYGKEITKKAPNVRKSSNIFLYNPWVKTEVNRNQKIF